MNVKTLENDLKNQLQGDVHFDSIHRHVYSVDASIYEIEPIGVVLPKNKQDLIRAIQIASEHNTPVIARGAATGITGGCIGKGLIIDTSKYLNRILEINYEHEYAICEPGVVQDRLNETLALKGYRLGPDTSTGNRATLGGMVANNAAGARSLLFGTMADHVEEVELILAGGKSLRFHALNDEQLNEKMSQNNTEGHIYREINRIRSTYKYDIEKYFPKIPRRVSGYNLDKLNEHEQLNLSKLITGSEGTLGIISEIKVKICKSLLHLGLCVIHLEDMLEGMKGITSMLSFHPISLEMIDDKIIDAGRNSPAMKNKLQWLLGAPKAVFIAEFSGQSNEEVIQKLNIFAAEMKVQHIGFAHVCITEPSQMKNVWELRKSGLGLLLSKRSYSRAIAFIEDLSIPPAQLPDFMERFTRYLKSKGKEAGIYGHVGSGCMHIRPYIDLRSHEELRLMEQMMKDISDLVLEHSGALSGEHGDGLIRSWLNKKMFGPQLYQAFTEVKNAFDPKNLMNPGKIVQGSPVDVNLRLDPQTHPQEIKTYLDFHKEGGFALAADLCNGNGMCRKSEKVMCPSFQATGDEYDTTRARAQVLRDIINRRLPIEELSGEGLHDVLDLCLECKGCKTECPSQVDMAKMKSEVLHHYHKKHGIPWRDWLFAHIGWINQLSAPIAKAFNFLSKSRLIKMILRSWGITHHRNMPDLASQRFSTWYKNYIPIKKHLKDVVLFNDTFTEFNQPQIGIAAIKVLEALGYNVIVPSWKCCGRPALSKGLLDYAKAQAESLVSILAPYANRGIPIIGLEPSCLLTIKDDFVGVLGHTNQHIDDINRACITFDEFLNSHIDHGQLPLLFQQKGYAIAVHGHCHQKAIVGMQPTLNVLRAIPGSTVTEIDSGCCGMAGSFGYETEHYEISMKIGELKLFPAIRVLAKDTVVVADGFSCRHQITHGTSKPALHLAEFLASVL